MPTVAERVRDYLNARLVPLCDDCIAKGLSLPRRQQAEAVTVVLGATGEFNRYDGTCMDCDRAPKKVIFRA